ncbi:phage baseplate assembly protein V [Enhygromyxa salina]|uniref:Phage-related baseplate assembly protein n=1 Tax=Enhygromyxa salina TaxID=215803 RepID=A0A2S9XIG1_9BACT|nr:phage baseplate assembly protein V [Enhygromyxa salina]PRP92668.1 Phage-related baseplate assembly protein [Enhygromyxa salina]
MADVLDQLLRAFDGRHFGKYRGVVKNNTLDEYGRIQVTVSSVLDDKRVWAMPCVPYAGKDVGMLFLPENEANVWIEFEGGDLSYPIWSGCYWKKEDVAGIKQDAKLKQIKTQKLTITIDDEAGSIKIENASGTVLEINGGNITATANGEITNQVKTMKTKLNVIKFDVHDGAMSVT